MDDSEELRFGPFAIDARGSRLLRDAVHITPKALQVLQHIARAAGTLVARQELFTAHWPDLIVTDDALKVSDDARKGMWSCHSPKNVVCLFTMSSPVAQCVIDCIL